MRHAGDMVIEYAGEVVRPSVSDLREARCYDALVGAGTYVFALHGGLFLQVVDGSWRAQLVGVVGASVGWEQGVRGGGRGKDGAGSIRDPRWRWWKLPSRAPSTLFNPTPPPLPGQLGRVWGPGTNPQPLGCLLAADHQRRLTKLNTRSCNVPSFAAALAARPPARPPARLLFSNLNHSSEVEY